MILIIDATGQQEYANNRFLDYTGKTEVKGLVSSSFTRTIKSQATASDCDVWHSESLWNWTFRVRRFDGVCGWMHSHIAPLKDKRGSITRWYGLLSDIDDGTTTDVCASRACEAST